MYDFLIVGSGIFGSVFAHQAKLKNKKCLIIDKRSTVGGNVYCKNIDGIDIHAYGAHIFHTNDKRIWDYVTGLVPFSPYTHSPMCWNKGKLYNLPFNMNTFYQMWGCTSPAEAARIIAEQSAHIDTPTNLKEQAIKMVGTDIYQSLVKAYTEKQWGRSCKDLPTSIIKRLPLRFTFDNNYFNDTFQGIPVGGYNPLISALTAEVEIRLNTDFFLNPEYFTGLADKVVFTGEIDMFFGYCEGPLAYRSLRFDHQVLEMSNFQGCSVVNYSDRSIPFTRIIEHKHFYKKPSTSTVITREYPIAWKPGMEPYYPVNDTENNNRYRRYKEMAANKNNVLFGGRLATYQYLDMHQVIAQALKMAESI